MRIAVVAPSTSILEETAEGVTALAAETAPGAELHFHPQCFLSHGHFAGEDRVRLEALVEAANDPAFDAIWFARGGYGSCRIAEAAIERLGPSARNKAWLGYSDAGFLLAGLYRAGFANLAHGPMPNDLRREGGEAAVRRGGARVGQRAPGAPGSGVRGGGGAGGRPPPPSPPPPPPPPAAP